MPPKTMWNLDQIKYLQRLYFIKSGKGNILLDSGEIIPLESGKIYIFPANMNQNCESDPDDPINHIFFDFISTPSIIADRPIVYEVAGNLRLEKYIGYAESLLYDLNDPQNICRLYTNRIPSAPDGSKKEYLQLVAECLNTLLILLSHIKSIPFTDDVVVIKTLDYIYEHYAEKITVDMLADLVGLNKIYYIRRFKKVMAITPYAYLRTYRLFRARMLISDGETLAEVAGKVGYLNANSLCDSLHK